MRFEDFVVKNGLADVTGIYEQKTAIIKSIEATRLDGGGKLSIRIAYSLRNPDGTDAGEACPLMIYDDPSDQKTHHDAMRAIVGLFRACRVHTETILMDQDGIDGLVAAMQTYLPGLRMDVPIRVGGCERV